MTRIATLTIAAIACLTLIPSIAQARYRGGDMNLYAYVGARPVNAVDPSGNRTIICDCMSETENFSYLFESKTNCAIGGEERACATACDKSNGIYDGTTYYSSGWREDYFSVERGVFSNSYTLDIGALCARIKSHSKCSACTDCTEQFEKLLKSTKDHPQPSPPDACEKWVDTFYRKANRSNSKACFKLERVVWTYAPYSWLPSWVDYKLRHVTLRVKLCDGTYFYVDNSWWGGDDHYFGSHEIPKKIVDEGP